MVESDHIRAIAIDGGGTHCRLALINGDQSNFVVSSATNATSDFNGSIKSILSGLTALTKHADTALCDISEVPAYIGIAGVIDKGIAEKLRSSLPFRHALVQDDRTAALRGALSSRNGVLAHCGTGSFFGRQQTGEQKLAGGWGPIIDDLASARWVGVRALRYTLYAVDGLVEQSALTKHLLDDHGGTSAIVRFAASATSMELGQLARTVTRFAAQNDVIALKVLTDGANSIAEQLLKLGWRDDEDICLTGGLGPHYRKHLPDSMRICVKEPRGQPLDGAIELAREFALRVAS